MFRYLCSTEGMSSHETRTLAVVSSQSMQDLEYFHKAVSERIGVNMHSALKIDGMRMAFVAGFGVYIRNVVRRSGYAMLSQVPLRSEDLKNVKVQCQRIATVNAKVFLIYHVSNVRGTEVFVRRIWFLDPVATGPPV